MRNFTIFSGTSNIKLANSINDITNNINSARGESYISSEMGKLKIEKFKDGEILPTFLQSVRGNNIYIVQTTNTSDAIVEVMLALDAAKRAGAKEITLVTPYYGYSRQDKVDHMRSSIGARVMADMFERGGATNIMTIDLHASAIQGFFNIPVIHLNGCKIFSNYIKSLNLDDLIIMSPDQGGVKRALDFAKFFPDSLFAQINKRRVKPNEIHSMDLIGSDVKGKNVVIIDDIADTLGTLKKASELVMQNGAKSVRAIATHGVLSGDAIANLNSSVLTELIISDTIDVSRFEGQSDKLNIISCANLIAKAIVSVESDMSIEALNLSI